MVGNLPIIYLVWGLLIFIVPLTIVMTIFGWMRSMKNDRSMAEQMSASNLTAMNQMTMAFLMRNQNQSNNQNFQAHQQHMDTHHDGVWGSVATNPDFYTNTAGAPLLANSVAAKSKRSGSPLITGLLVAIAVFLFLILVTI